MHSRVVLGHYTQVMPNKRVAVLFWNTFANCSSSNHRVRMSSNSCAVSSSQFLEYMKEPVAYFICLVSDYFVIQYLCKHVLLGRGPAGTIATLMCAQSELTSAGREVLHAFPLKL
jgi:hypothetical protein